MIRRPPTQEGEQPEAASAPRRRRPTKDAVLERGPWLPTEYAVADASAFQALQRGDANPEQQRRALAWLMNATGIRDLSYRPGGEDGRRDSDFAEGKRFVGLQVAKLMTADIARMRRSEPDADPHEPQS